MIAAKLGSRTLVFVIILILLIAVLYSFWKLELISMYAFASLSVISVAFVILNVFDRYRQLENIAETVVKKGDEAYKKGDLGSAIKHYKDALGIYKDSFNAHNGIGNCYRKQNNWEVALKNYEKACTINPDSAMVHYNMGLSFQKLNKVDEALNSLNKSVKINKNLIEAYLVIGDIYKSNGNDNEAVEMYETFLEYSQDEEASATVRKKLETAKKIRDEKSS
ncbi:MAG: tetratricopeptide repeat protein [Firmicutes bacterium]|nr:tetratricopeptide repeat protein [Bacillota bacterium]